MPGYRVYFFNEIPQNERFFRCCQRSIVIRAARPPEPAIEAAKKRFARLEGIHDWKTRASLIDIEPIALKPQAFGKATQCNIRIATMPAGASPPSWRI
jgi:hypothetical protein